MRESEQATQNRSKRKQEERWELETRKTVTSKTAKPEADVGKRALFGGRCKEREQAAR